MGGHAVTQTMDMSLFADTALLEGAAKSSLQRAVVDGAGVVRDAVFEAMPGHGREKPERRTMGGPELAQSLQGLLGQGHQSLLVALAAHAQEHAGGVQVGNLQAATFIQAQRASINSRQANPINGCAHAAQNFLDFLSAEHDRQLLGLGWTQEFEAGPISLESGLEEEFDAAERDGGGGAGHFLFQREMEEILAQFLLGDEIGGFAIVFGQSAHCPAITGVSVGVIAMELSIR